MTNSNLSVAIIIPTYEPDFVSNDDLLSIYKKNFTSLLNPQGVGKWSIWISDFKSSEAFKSFLREFAEENPGRVNLMDGSVSLSSFQAVNMAIKHSDADIYIWMPSDVCVRDKNWLLPILEDFADPDVLAVIPTATIDGAAVIPQTQPGPINRPSKIIKPPKFFQMVSAAFHRNLLEPFDWQLCDRFTAQGNDKGVSWQAEALNGKIMLNFQSNLIHDRSFDAGRHQWNNDVGRIETRADESIISKKIGETLPLPGGWFRYSPSWISEMLKGWHQKKIYGLARAIWIRAHYIQILYVYKMITRNAHHVNYLKENILFKSKLKKFRKLGTPQRIELVEKLFMGDPAIYGQSKFIQIDNAANERVSNKNAR
jgi:hypothetical protein